MDIRHTTNFKREGRVICSHGHSHRDATSARICEAAWRIVERKRLAEKYRTDELVAELRKIVFKTEGQ